MATFTVTNTKYITELTGKTGNDTYNINGGSLIIDCDTRYAQNATPTASVLGNINVSSSLGGNLTVTTENTVILQVQVTSGIVPASGTAITQGAVTGELLCVMQMSTGGLVYSSGATTPSVVWLKIRKTSANSFTTGALSSGSLICSALSDEQQGWIVLAGVQNGTHSHPRIGTMQFRGDWLNVGVTTGSRGQTVQLPHFTAESVTAYGGVEIETSMGSGVYQFWPNAGNRFTTAVCSLDSRSSFVHITEQGLVYIGRDTLGNDCGFVPSAGCNIRIPSIITQNCLTTNTNLNITPQGTMGSRYECAFSSAGNANISKVTGAWYWNIVQPYSCTINDLHSCDQVVIQEVATHAIINNLHVGLSVSSTNFASNAINIAQCYNGGTVNNMSWIRADAVSTSGYAAVIVNLYGGWNFTNLRGGNLGVPTAVAGALYVNTSNDIVIDNLKVFCKRVLITSCLGLTIKNIQYADTTIGTTSTSVGCHIIEASAKVDKLLVENLFNWPDAPNSHPYNGLFYCNTVFDSKFRNVGSPSTPFNCGTVNLPAYIWSDGGNNADLKFQRIWTTGLRVGLISGTNTTKRITAENCYMTDATKTIGPQQLDSVIHGNRFNAGSVPTSYIAVYGQSCWDGFTGDTTTRGALIFVEKTSANPSAYEVTSGTPRFTSQGALVMQSVGDSITYTWPWKILGWAGLTTMVSQGANTVNHLFEYDIDKGSGFSGVFRVLNNANLTSETGIDPVIGFTPKIRITCSVGATGNRLDSLRFDGVTSLALQNTALYPLDKAVLNLDNLLTGSNVAVFIGTPTNGSTPVVSANVTTSSASLTYSYDQSVTSYTVRIRKAGYFPIDITYQNALETTIPIAQQGFKDGYGVDIYGRGDGTTSAFVTLDGPNRRIDIGNQLCKAEDVFDVVSNWSSSLLGIIYDEVIRFDGRDLLLMGPWRLRRGLPAYTNAGIDSVVVVDGMSTASPDDEVNGSVDIRAKAVRTFDSSGGTVTPATLAAAVWAYTLNTGNTAESELLATKTNASNAFAAAL